MCAICGIVNFDSANRVDPTSVVDMAELMSHRGPDDEGYFIDHNVALGHRRLSIIDLSGGQQPIFNEDGSKVVVFNGEIYNYRDLTARLQTAGHRFQTRSDTEAILHAYEELGDACVDELRGMFAFAIWDRRQRRLLLARDRLGIKPLYYYQGDRFLAFASEVKALLALPGVPRAVDRESLDLYLSLRYVPGPRTMFRDIFKLQPGHTLALEGSRVRIRRYWDIEYGEEPGRPDAELAEQFEALFRDSVDLRLISEVPLGVMLSGGLDSSSVVAQMTELVNGGIKTFSVGYPDAVEERDSDELDQARRVAAHFRTDHHEFRLGADDFGDFLDRLVWHLDEPLADPTCIPLYFISKLAREHVTVVLSGEGADEILAGYGIYPRMLMLERLHGIPGVAPLAGAAAGRLPYGSRWRRYLEALSEPLQRRYRGVARAFLPALKSRLLGLSGAAASEYRLLDLLDHSYQSAAGATALDRMLYLDTKTWLPDDLLLKADRMTMANGMELRVPFLDHRLVELAAKLPQRLKLRRRQGKQVLRQTIGRKLPSWVLDQHKRGFPVPTSPWLRRHLRRQVRQRLLGAEAACPRYLDKSVIAGVVGEHLHGGIDRGQELWALMVFEAWHKQFIEQPVKTTHRQPHASLVLV